MKKEIMDLTLSMDIKHHNYTTMLPVRVLVEMNMYSIDDDGRHCWVAPIDAAPDSDQLGKQVPMHRIKIDFSEGIDE